MKLRTIVTLAVCLLGSQFLRAEVRTWSDRRGNSVEAEFVRITGDQITLKRTNRKVIRLSVSELTDEDQKFARAAQAASRSQEWTVDGEVALGKYLGFDNGNARVRIYGKLVEIPYADLTSDQKDFVRDQLDARGQLSLLDNASTAASSAPRERDPAQDDPAQGDDADGMRIWTSSGGKQVKGRLVDASNDKVVLFVEKTGKKHTLPLGRFSGEDQQFVENWMLSNKLPESGAEDFADLFFDGAGAHQIAATQPDDETTDIDIDARFEAFKKRMSELKSDDFRSAQRSGGLASSPRDHNPDSSVATATPDSFGSTADRFPRPIGPRFGGASPQSERPATPRFGPPEDEERSDGTRVDAHSSESSVRIRGRTVRGFARLAKPLATAFIAVVIGAWWFLKKVAGSK